MTPQDFESLRSLPDKKIHGDIELRADPAHPTSYRADSVRVENAMGVDLRLNVTLKPDLPSVTFNFSVLGVGPICRLDINGTSHGDAGRTHKHEFEDEKDPQRNLPNARPRTDLEGASLEKAWDSLCEAAKIRHDGQIIMS